MQLNSRFAGTKLRGYSTTVSWRDTMNYAAAVGDANPVFFNDDSEAGIVAPPMISTALTWPVSERLAEYVEADGGFPREIFQRQVHYTEHLEFQRPLLPGTRLDIRGSIAAISPHSAGTYIAIRYDALNEDGLIVFTEHIGGLLRDVACEGEARGMDALPLRYNFKAKEATCWSSAVSIDRLMPFLYDGCTGIFFPIHTSRKFARKVGLPDIILQGTATLALAVREITNREAGADPGRVAVVSCRFTGMVFPGSTISVSVTGIENDSLATHIRFTVLDEKGNRAVTDGYVRIRP